MTPSVKSRIPNEIQIFICEMYSFIYPSIGSIKEFHPFPTIQTIPKSLEIQKFGQYLQFNQSIKPRIPNEIQISNPI